MNLEHGLREGGARRFKGPRSLFNEAPVIHACSDVALLPHGLTRPPSDTDSQQHFARNTCKSIAFLFRAEPQCIHWLRASASLADSDAYLHEALAGWAGHGWVMGRIAIPNSGAFEDANSVLLRTWSEISPLTCLSPWVDGEPRYSRARWRITQPSEGTVFMT